MTFAEQLKGQLDIVEVISQYIRLKRAGSTHRYIGLCPFHSEKTPSFHVNAANQFYYCFGCQATGDVFKFVQEMDSLTFPETLKSLAERNGIPVPQRQRADDPEAQRREALLEMHEIAADVFQNNLRGANGTEAREYLKSRGMVPGTMDEFRLGLSDAGGQQLVARLQRFGTELMEQSGLVKRRETGGFYDTFRGRLMFPIHSEQGKVIAFGGRALRPDDNPKYLNSSDTKIYKKSSILYNLHRAKTDARKRDRMILVEGYMDAIGLAAAGIREVVAVCGTSLSHEQVRAIKRQISQQQANTGRVILNFDPDAAGARSAEKYIASFLAEGLRVRVLELPGGLDPDEFIQQNGSDAYSQLLDAAESYHHWLALRARTKFDMRTVEGRVDAFKSLLPSLQHVHDRLERSAIIGEIAEYLKLDRDLIAQQLKQTGRASDHRSGGVSAIAPVPPNELLLLNCLLLSGSARAAIKHYLATNNLLSMLEMRAIFEAVIEVDEAEGLFSIDEVSRKLEPRLQRIMANLSFSGLAMDDEDAAQQAIHCLRALEAKAHEARCTELRQRIRVLEQQGNFENALALMTELDNVKTAHSGV
ncbi:MAG TPA: DNA primase [Bryobacteraceae bacterium]|jgi:DNA primase|nr:DNA primase [Bryobacteraceae bacterium]